MVVTTQRKKIEILVDLPLLNRLTDLAKTVGITSYTLQRATGGDGEQGYWRDEQVTGGAGSKTFFSTIVDESHTDAFLNVIEPLLDEYGYIVTVANVSVIRGNKF